MPEKAQNINILLKEKASLKDTEKNIIRIVNNYSYQVSDIAKDLKGNSIKETAYNIWVWVRQNIKYVEDDEGKEQLRRPARIIEDGLGDCDCLTILICSLLKENNIESFAKITAYPKKDDSGKYKKNFLGGYISDVFSHIYPFCLDENFKPIYLDTVPQIKKFNTEYQPITKFKIINMELYELAGTPDNIVENSEDFEETFDYDEYEDEYEELEGFEGNDFDEDDFDENEELEGFDEENEDIFLQEQILGKIVIKEDINGRLNQKNARKAVIVAILLNSLELFENSEDENLKKEVEIIKNILKNPDINSSLMYAVKNSKFPNFYAEILDELINDDETDNNQRYSLVQESNTEKRLEERELGRISLFSKKKKNTGTKKTLKDKIFNKNKDKKPLFKNGGTNIKKVALAPARAAFLVLIRMNAFGYGTRLALGLATTKEAIASGLTSAEHPKFVAAKNNFFKKWVEMGGKESELEKAIREGRAKKKVELNGLGAVGASIAAASVTAAPVLAIAHKFLKPLKDVSKSIATKRTSTSSRKDNKKGIFKNLFNKDKKEKKGIVKNLFNKGTEIVKDVIENKYQSDEENADVNDNTQRKEQRDTTPKEKTFKEKFAENKFLYLGILVAVIVVIILIIVFAVKPSKSLKGTPKRRKRKTNVRRKPIRRKITASRKTATKRKVRKSLNGVKRKTTKALPPAKRKTKAAKFKVKRKKVNTRKTKK